jgi:O-antigen/teichoic acid export membrane protein
VLNFAQIVVGFILPPLLIHTLGLPVYDDWLNVVALTGFINLFLAGVPMATVKEFTHHIASKDQERLNRSIASAMWLYVAMGAAACVAGFALYAFFDRVYAPDIVKSLGEGSAHKARAAFVVTVLQVAFGFVSQVPAAILTAHRDFMLRNAITIGGILLRLALVVVWLRADASLLTLALIHAIQMVIESSLTAVIVVRRYPGTKLGLAFDKAEVRSIVGFSAYVLLLAVGYKLLFQTSAPILKEFGKPGSVAAFDSAKNLVLYLTDMVLAIGAVAMPTAIKLRVEKRENELARMFLQWSKVALSMALVAGLYLVVVGEDFLRVWIRKAEFDSAGAGSVLTVLMVSHFVFLPIRGVGLPIVMGLGKPERPAIAFLLSGVLNLVIALALVKSLGMIGVALGLAVCDVLFALYVLRLVCKELGVPLSRYVSYVAGRASLGAVPVFLLLLGIKWRFALDGWVPVIATGIASTALFAIIWVAWVYKDDPYIDAAGRLKRLFGLARKPAA